MLGPMLAADEAERRGDVLGALAVIRADLDADQPRPFWSPDRVQRLLQVLLLGDDLPGWARSRWLVEQALQYKDSRLRSAHLRAFDRAVELRGGVDRLTGNDDLDARSRVIERDWVYRQLVVHEHGGLDLFLRRGAVPDLMAGADRIHEWANAPMRVLRLESTGSLHLEWRDVATGEEVRVPNLGAAVLVLPGEHVLGRLVPVEGGSMLDGPPLRISEGAAEIAAADPARWFEALRHDAGSETYFPSIMRGNFLLTDVPPMVSHAAIALYLADPRARPLAPEDVADAVLALARDTVAGRIPCGCEDLDPWPCLAAELLSPSTMAVLPDRIRSEDAPVLEVLVRRLPAPAGDLCQELICLLDTAA